MATSVFDPESVPVDSIAGESGLETTRLTVDWLRRRFANPPDWQQEIVDEPRLFLPGKSYTDASVLIAIVQREAGLNVLLTRRTAHLTEHAGQISFPGGRVDPGDSSAVDTALREASEEIGLDREHVEVLGLLPEYYTGTGYRVTPVVSVIQSPLLLQAQASEVAEIFEVPFDFLMDGRSHQRRSAAFRQGWDRRTFYTMPYRQYFIWGATAGMLRNLFHFLRA